MVHFVFTEARDCRLS